MDVCSTLPQEATSEESETPMASSQLQRTPACGVLGPGSDVAAYTSEQASGRRVAPRFVQLIAAVIGMLAALVAGTAGKAYSAWPSVTNAFSSQKTASPGDAHQLERMHPQKQAETLLELAVGNSPGAVEQISSRVNRWHGKVQWNSQIANLTTAALNSTDMRVRESGVEVELAAYGLSKNSESLDYLLSSVNSPSHAQKIWSLWALGLMANRGVRSDEVVEVLKTHLNDSDEDSRRWAVEGLALSGSDQSIKPLLKSMHDDPSPQVRERAACSLAESGMFSTEQRMTAVPNLLNYTDDPALDQQTHAWAFHALADITHQRFGNDSSAWRRWFESQ